jgi:methylated-DNA-[protein]-cysteine S-methyltransferase
MDSTTLTTPAGQLSLVVHASGAVAAAGFCPMSDLEARLGESTTPRPELGEVSRAMTAYLDGDLTAVDSLDVDQPGTVGQQAVWRALRDINPGMTVTYGELARTLGLSTGASRSVGSACGANLIAPIVPCHRVVRAGTSPVTNRLGGYYYGLGVKEWLLGHEARAV